MKITAWRIFKRRYKASAFTGEGARLFGGRWNSKGSAVVYTSASPSLAVLEMLVGESGVRSLFAATIAVAVVCRLRANVFEESNWIDNRQLWIGLAETLIFHQVQEIVVATDNERCLRGDGE